LVGWEKNNGSGQIDGSTVVSSQEASSADDAQPDLSDNISTQTSKEYLKADPTKSEAYNTAINAYNLFLSGETNATDKIANKAFNIKEMDALNKPGINSFALFDVNGDGIPELHTRSDFYDVFSYQDGQLVRLYTSGVNLMDGSVTALDNGGIFSVHDSTGTEYQYTTFDPDGKATTISFFDPNDSSGKYPYYFNDKEVSKKDYDNLTKEYIALSKKPASIQWHDAQILNDVKSLFEEAENRSFDVSFPVKIEGEDCYKIIVSGKLASNQTYPIDTLAVNPNDYKRYFLDKETDTYERYFTAPTFACKTSPDGKLRIESVGMDHDGPSGLHSLKEMRIINTSTGDVLWSGVSYLSNEFLWSEDSRFVAAGYAGRQWRQTDIVDTKNYSVIHIPNVDDILSAVPNTSKPNENAPLSAFEAVNWLSPSTVSIQFQWTTDTDTVVSGEYEYDVINNKMDIKVINEESRG
jgi:hypothetical protein